MDIDKFAEGYREPPSYQRYRDEDPELRAFLEGPRKQASIFDRFATLYLKGGLTDEPEKIYRTLIAYEDEWLMPHLPATERQARKLNQQAVDHNGIAVSEIGFHALNKEMLPLWESLLLPTEFKPSFGPDEYHAIQTRLAIAGAHLSLELHQARAKAERRSSLRELPRALVGRLNEIDTAITLLEFVKTEAFTLNHSSLILVPAPPRFEAGHKNKTHNADFLLIDTELQQARGIQVKSHLDAKAAQFDPTTGAATINGYDGSFVTIIDCSTDLGNNTTRGGWVSSQPGNIALEYLNERVSVRQSSLHPILKSSVGNIIQAKGIARELTRAEPRTPELSNSVQRIAPRLIHDLYK